MIKLKPLLESIISKPFSDIDGRNYLISRYETAFEKWLAGDVLYRGHTPRRNYEEVYPSQGERQSIDASNIYTVCLSKLPSWKGWPQRSHSLIFSNSQQVAGEYGLKIVYVFPDENAKIVIAPGPDVFGHTSFPVLSDHTEMSINELGVLSEIMFVLDNSQRPDDESSEWNLDNVYYLKEKDYEKFIQHLQSITTKIKILKIYRRLVSEKKNRILSASESKLLRFTGAYLKNYKIHNGNWELFLDFLLNPKTNGFNLVPFSKLKKTDYDKYGNRNEMWTDSNCMLINLKEEPYLKELGKNVLI